MCSGGWPCENKPHELMWPADWHPEGYESTGCRALFNVRAVTTAIVSNQVLFVWVLRIYGLFSRKIPCFSLANWFARNLQQYGTHELFPEVTYHDDVMTWKCSPHYLTFYERNPSARNNAGLWWLMRDFDNFFAVSLIICRKNFRVWLFGTPWRPVRSMERQSNCPRYAL